MRRLLQQLYTRFVKLFFSEWFVRIQANILLPFMNILLGITGLYMYFIKQAMISHIELYSLLICSFGSLMIILAWYDNVELTPEKTSLSAGIKRVDFNLLWIVYAILIWEIFIVMPGIITWGFPEFNLKSENNAFTVKFIASLFSIVNNIFLLLAAKDMDFEVEPKWKRLPVLKYFDHGKYIFYYAILTVVITILIYLGLTLSALFDLQSGAYLLIELPDLIMSSVVLFILGSGFILIFNQRFIARIPDAGHQKKLKKYFLYSLLGSVFVAIAIVQWIDFISLLHAFSDDTIEVLMLFYRTSVVILLLMIQISWVKMQLGMKIKTLNNELSHRVKNYMDDLSSDIQIRLRNQDIIENPVAQQHLRAVYANFQLIKQIQEQLLGDPGNEHARVVLDDFLTKLCIRLLDLYHFKSHILDITIPDDGKNTIPHYEASMIGIILNELISNVYKHANTEKEKVKIQIAIKMNNRNLVILVSDNGISETGTPAIKKNMGLHSIEEITKLHFKGTIEMGLKKAGHGWFTKIKIPLENIIIAVE